MTKTPGWLACGTLAVTCLVVPRAGFPADTEVDPARPESPISAIPEARPSEFDTSSLNWNDGPSGDGRRTLGRFPVNLGRNLIGVFSTDNVNPLLFGAGAAGLGHFLDDNARNTIRQPDRRLAALGDTAGKARSIVPLAVGLFLTGRASRDSQFRAATYDLAQVTAVNAFYTYALKQAVQRTRPDGSSQLSFPSGHASNAVAWATVADHHYGHRVGIPMYVAAGLIGVSRVQKDKHYLSDVLAGAALGFVAGRTVVRRDGEVLREERRWSLAPTTAPDGSGIGLAFSLSFDRR